MTQLSDLVGNEPEPQTYPELSIKAQEALRTRSLLAELLDDPRATVRLRKSDPFWPKVEAAETAFELGRRQVFAATRGHLSPGLEETIALTLSGGAAEVKLRATDALTTAAQGKKAALPELRHIADRLRLVIVPAAYVAESIWDGAQQGSGNPALAFRDEMASEFQVFVLGPVSIYDPAKHATFSENLPLYYDSENQAMLALDLLMPVVRGLISRVGQVEQRVQGIEQELEGVRSHVERLELQLGQQLREQALRNEDLAGRVQHLEARVFVRRDPLIFALLRGESIITSSSFAMLGPCWGEDLDDLALRALGLL